MTSIEKDYVLGHEDAELARLEHQAGILAPATEAILRMAGLAPGMRVLDLGTGLGDVAFAAAGIVGPAGEEMARAHAHAAMAYMIPTYSKNQDTARAFIMHLVANYEAALLASKLYNFPTFPDTAPGLQDALRITIGTDREMAAVHEALTGRTTDTPTPTTTQESTA